MIPHHPSRRVVLAAGLAALAAPALARAAPATRTIGGPAFGTEWRVTLRADDDDGRLRPGIEEVLARIDRLMSPRRPDSTIPRFNRDRSTGWQPADAGVVAVTHAALSVRAASGGAFDPAVRPLVGRWGFGPITGEAADAAAFDLAGDALRKADAGLTLDLCGIAKGHALDRMVRLLREHGEMSFVADLGGEVAACGSHPGGRRWQVAVEDPRPGHDGAAAIIALDGRAIATSGDRSNGFTLGTRRYSHIIDPVTAEPVQGGAASVSVIAGDGTATDAWATALMAAGAGGPALARRNGLDALFLFREGGLRRVPVGRFDANLV